MEVTGFLDPCEGCAQLIKTDEEIKYKKSMATIFFIVRLCLETAKLTKNMMNLIRFFRSYYDFILKI